MAGGVGSAVFGAVGRAVQARLAARAAAETQELSVSSGINRVTDSARLLPEFSQTTVDEVLASSRFAKGQTTRGASLLQKRLADSTIGGIEANQANAEKIISDVLSNPIRVQQTGRFGQIDVIGESFGQRIGIRINTQTGQIIGFRRPNF